MCVRVFVKRDRLEEMSRVYNTLCTCCTALHVNMTSFIYLFLGGGGARELRVLVFNVADVVVSLEGSIGRASPSCVCVCVKLLNYT